MKRIRTIAKAARKAIARNADASRREGKTMTETAMVMAVGRTAKSEGGDSEGQSLPKTSVPLVPPKPNEFFTATLIGILRATLAQ